MLAQMGYAGLGQIRTFTKDCLWGNLKFKEIEIEFLTFWDIILGTQFIKIWFLSNFAPHHLSYRNFLNICCRRKIQKPTERSFCQLSHAISISFNRWLVISVSEKNRQPKAGWNPGSDYLWWWMVCGSKLFLWWSQRSLIHVIIPIQSVMAPVDGPRLSWMDNMNYCYSNIMEKYRHINDNFDANAVDMQ